MQFNLRRTNLGILKLAIRNVIFLIRFTEPLTVFIDTRNARMWKTALTRTLEFCTFYRDL